MRLVQVMDLSLQLLDAAAVEGAKPLRGNAYKVTLARTAVKRALLEAVKART